MIKILFSFGCFLFCVMVYGQTIRPISIPEQEFVVDTTYVDQIRDIKYQIGRRQPEGYIFIADSSGALSKVSKSLSHQKGIYPLHYPIYLKIQKNNAPASYYDLDTYHDPDMFSVLPLSSGHLMAIEGRYHFYLYDVRKDVLSHKLIPAQGKYESEDAISGLYDALTLYDDEKLLFGNVQGYGIFCFDVSDVTNPKELQSYTSASENREHFSVYLREKQNGLSDVLIAQIDPSSRNLVERLYKKFSTIRYLIRDIKIKKNGRGESQIQQGDSVLLIETVKTLYRIDLTIGTVATQQ